jgi:MerR family transcriptional regulator, redox-sensitive transcriptional activator SoxR
MRISEVAQCVGVRPSTIRYYERIGLLPSPSRANGRRTYEAEVLDRLTLIRFGLNVGFSLKELSSLFADFGSRSARRKAAQGRLQGLRSLQERLKLIGDMLEAVQLCRCGTIHECVMRLQKAGALSLELPPQSQRTTPGS